MERKNVIIFVAGTLAVLFAILTGILIKENIRLKNQRTEMQKLVSEIKDIESNYTMYSNNEYGFSVALPASWKNFSIIKGTWESNPIDNEIETGEIINIRNPKWSEEDPTQDIPVMVFTYEQWNKIDNDQLHIGAAPINPSLLLRTSKYYFALPARYNFGMLKGYEEVDTIVTDRNNFIDNNFYTFSVAAIQCKINSIFIKNNNMFSITLKDNSNFSFYNNNASIINALIPQIEKTCGKIEKIIE